MAHLMGERQRWAWLAAAWSIITAACLCGYGWNWVLPGTLAAALYYIVMDRRVPAAGLSAVYGNLGKGGALLSVITWLWLALLLAWSAARMEQAYPKIQSYPALSWVLLALAAWASSKGSGACAGCSGVLSLALLVHYGIIGAFAVPDLEPAAMAPTGTWDQAVKTWGLCLIPAGIWLIPISPERRKNGTAVALGLAAGSTVLAAWTAGVLSPKLAAVQAAPLYELARSVSVLGVMERIEPLLSAAMTMGLFSLLAMLACGCQELGTQLKPRNGYGILACILAAFLLPTARTLPIGAVALGCTILWVVVPILALGISQQKGAKREK